MVAPVPTDSSAGWAWTNRMLRTVTRDTLRTGRRAFRWVVWHGNPARSGKHSGVDYPELAARTRRFSYGAPRALTVSGDGERVVFLRSSGPEDPNDALWIFDVRTGEERLIVDPADESDLPLAERALRERLRLSASGIGSYAVDSAGRIAVFTLGGKLFRADLVTAETTELTTAGPAVDARPDPAGEQVAYVTGGALHVIGADGTDAILANEAGVTWGLAE